MANTSYSKCFAGQAFGDSQIQLFMGFYTNQILLKALFMRP